MKLFKNSILYKLKSLREHLLDKKDQRLCLADDVLFDQMLLQVDELERMAMKINETSRNAGNLEHDLLRKSHHEDSI